MKQVVGRDAEGGVRLKGRRRPHGQAGRPFSGRHLFR